MEEQNENQEKEKEKNYPSASLYVGDLHPDITEAFLYEIFKEAGSIVSIRVCRDTFTRESLGYAYVNYKIPQDAERALTSLNYTVVNDKPIRIMWAHKDPTLRRKTGIGNVFIKGLDAGIDNKCLYDTFSAFGDILSSKVQHSPGRKTGVGYVHFSSFEAAQRAVDKVDGKQLNGKIVTVEHYKRDRKGGTNDTNFTNVYVRNLKKEIDDEKLAEILTQYGPLQKVTVVVSKTGESKGVAFCNFDTHEAALVCVEGLHDNEEHAQEGKKLMVCRSMKKSERVRYLREKFAKEGPPLYKNPGTNVYVKHLDESVDDEKLRELFQEYGTVTSAVVMKDEKSGISKCFGFVNFSKSEEATRAINQMSEKRVGTKPIYVALAQPKELRRQEMLNRFSKYQRERGAGGYQLDQGIRQGGYHRGAYHRGGYYRGRRGAYDRLRRWGGPPHLEPHHESGPPRNFYPPPQGFNQNRMSHQARNPFNAEEYDKQQQQQFPGPQGPHPQGPQGPVPKGRPPIPNPQSLASMGKKEQKHLLGEHLFPLVRQKCQNQDEAGKITGMLLEMDNTDLIHLLETPEALRGKISEAEVLLRKHKAQKSVMVVDSHVSTDLSKKQILEKEREGGMRYHGPPAPPTKEENLSKKMEEKMTQLSEELKLMKQENERKIKKLTNEIETQNRKIQRLEEEKEKEKRKVVLLERKFERKLEESRKEYEKHFDLYHRKKYSITKHIISPQMLQNREEKDKYYCFENETFKFYFEFSISSGPGSIVSETPIDFSSLQVLMSGTPLLNIKHSHKSIEFGFKYPKIGLYELSILFQNIKKTFQIEVERPVVCCSKCELFLFRGEVHPSGNITRFSQATDKLSSKDPILVVLKLVNENGIPLKKEHFEELCLTAKICEEGKKIGMKGILSSGKTLEVDFDDLDFNEKGEVLICTIEEDKLKSGYYLISVYEDDFGSIKRKFSILE